MQNSWRWSPQLHGVFADDLSEPSIAWSVPCVQFLAAFYFLFSIFMATGWVLWEKQRGMDCSSGPHSAYNQGSEAKTHSPWKWSGTCCHVWLSTKQVGNQSTVSCRKLFSHLPAAAQCTDMSHDANKLGLKMIQGTYMCIISHNKMGWGKKEHPFFPATTSRMLCLDVPSLLLFAA